jgi:hypothetical protein
VPIERREPLPNDLADPAVAVLDVGHRHEPALNNFDHHQLPKDHPPTCSLSLVLQHLGLYADARQFCDWLEPAEWFDCRGPIATAKFLGVDRNTLPKLNSPIDITLLRRFALATRLEPTDPLWAIMRMIGEDLLNYVRSLRARLDFIARHAEVWTLDLADAPAKILFLPRTDPLPEEPSLGIDRYIEAQGLAAEIVATAALAASAPKPTSGRRPPPGPWPAMWRCCLASESSGSMSRSHIATSSLPTGPALRAA